MIVLAGGELVLPDRVATGSLVIDDGRIADLVIGTAHPAGADVIDVSGSFIVPGFIDVHVHGLAGTDLLDGPEAVATVASALPRHGVTGFCPTSVACDPATLAVFLDAIVRARAAPDPTAAAVLKAHLESNFINPKWNGAQPAQCLRTFGGPGRAVEPAAFAADAILQVLADARDAVSIVTIAPEIEGGFDLLDLLRSRGHIVSIGHSGATYVEAREAISRGVSHATHLFNRMTPLTHREPGIVGAVLESTAVAAEIICDGVHVHPSAVALTVRAKTPSRVMAITDGTAAAGLPLGSRARLGGRPILAGARSATLEDGTLAGSIATMDVVFRTLVGEANLTLNEAAQLCATTPAHQLQLADRGRLERGTRADLVVLDGRLAVRATWIAGRPVVEH